MGAILEGVKAHTVLVVFLFLFKTNCLKHQVFNIVKILPQESNTAQNDNIMSLFDVSPKRNKGQKRRILVLWLNCKYSSVEFCVEFCA